jgi:hypothetical protein
MKNLYSFGCSDSSVNFKNAQYKYRGYPEHKLYNELLAEELNLNLINDAYEGRGNNSIILKFVESDFKNTDLVIIQLTFPHRIEFRKDNIPVYMNPHTISQPITSATLPHVVHKLITQKQFETYIDFVNEWENILMFTDIFNIVNSIKLKQKKYPNCKFLLITPNEIKKEIFTNNLDLYKNINLNGFYKMGIETWEMYGKLINDDRYIDDKHFSPIGNQKLYEIILNILENE